MFGKTLLSIVALLFSANRFVLASAIDFKEIPDCPEAYTSKNTCSGSGNAETYCYSVNNRQLIGFSSTNSDKSECDVVFDLTASKVNIVSLGTTIGSADLSNLASANIANIAIYDCDANTCQRVTGLLKKTGDAEYYYIGTTSGDDEAVNLGTGDTEYLVYDTDKADAKVYKYQVDGQKKYADENGKNVCVDGTSVIWSERSDALCNAESDCTNYYDCIGGVCTLSRKNSLTVRDTDCKPSDTGVEHCDPGYHLTNADGSALAASNGKLWYCDAHECNAVSTGIGYFVNADDSNKPNILCVNNGGVQKCDKIAGFDYGTCDEIGKVITRTQDGSDYALCLATSGTGLLLSSDEVKGNQYMVEIDKSSGLYEIKPNTDASDSSTQYYLVVSIDNDGNVKVVKETKPVRYRYTNGNDQPLIYDRYAAQTAKAGDDDNAICKTNHNPFEYKLDQWTSALQNNTFAEFYIVESE